MPKPTHKQPVHATQEEQHQTPFFDCVAYLLAKRWLQDQRQAEASPQEYQGYRDKHRPKKRHVPDTGR